MDATLKRLTDFTTGLGYSDLTAVAVHECKRRILDTLACVLGGFNSEPSKIARAIARKTGSVNPARILGTLEYCSPEHAAFANGVMIRCLDLNDASGKGGGGHPSDALAALLAIADWNEIDGKALITANVIVYELALGFFAGVNVRHKGWDHVVFTVLAAAAGAARLLKLGHAATANALSLSLTPNMAMEVVRRGELTMWKGCAGANAARNGVFAAMLAAEGMTAPAEVFEGEQGVWNAVGKFDWPLFAGKDRPFRVADSQIKMYPCEYHGGAPIEAMLAIREQIRPDDIEKIVVRTYWYSWSEIGSEPAKWNPTTRETADHSLPFLVCAALLDGTVNIDTFSDERIADPQLRSLIQKVEVIHDKELDKFTPDATPCRMEVRLKNGEKIFSNIDFPKGHVHNPASDKEIEGKLVSLNRGMLSPRQISKLLDSCWRLEELSDVRELISTMRI